MAERVNDAVATASFDKDNYARRMLRRIIKTVNRNAEILEMVEISPYEKIATYTSAVNDEFPDAGISWTDFTPAGSKTLVGAKSIAIEIQGISVGASTTYGNKAVEITVLDRQNNVIMETNDANNYASFELFKMTKADSGEIYAELSGRAPSSDVDSEKIGFCYKSVGLSDDTVFPNGNIEFGDINIAFTTNQLTQNRPIVISIYAQY